jgi:outer membrane receptor protein involved in Fe transport
VSGTLSGFYYTVHDLIVQTDIGGGFVQPQNVGTSRAQGLELDLRKQWLSGALVRFGGVLQNAEDENGQHRVDSPYTIVNAGLVVPVVSRNNTFAVDFQYLGDRRTRTGSDTHPSYLTTLHFRSRDVLGFRNFDFTATVNNLFNEDAFTPGGSEHRQDLIPSPRRLVLFGLQYRF